MYTKKAVVYLGVIVAAGVAVRCYGLSHRTFWFDEAFSNRLISDFSWSEMIERTGRDVHPPLYYVVLRLWAGVLGDGIVTLRLFSVFLAAVTLVGVYQLVYEASAHGHLALEPLRARAAGLSAAAILASTTLHIYWSQETRMYTLGTALVAWSSWFLLRAVRLDSLRWYLTYGVSAAALMYTHNYGLFTVLGQGVFVVAYFVREGRKTLWTLEFFRAGLAMLGAACLYAPWLPVLLAQKQRVSVDYWIEELSWWSLPDACQELVLPINSAHVPDHLLSLLCALFMLVIIGFLAWFPNRGRGLLLALIVVPAYMSIMISLVSVPIVHSRYFQFAYVAAVCGFSTILFDLAARVPGAIMTGVVVVSALTYTNDFYRHELQVPARPGIKGAVEYVRNEMGANEPLLVTHPCVYYSVRRYLRGETRPLLYLPRGDVAHYMGSPIFVPEDACGETEVSAFRQPRMWVIETTGYTLNWETEPLPNEWIIDRESLREFPEICYFQGVVRAYRCHRVGSAKAKDAVKWRVVPW